MGWAIALLTFQFVGHCPTYILFRGPLPYLHFVGHCPTRVLPSRGPLPYYHSFRGPALLPLLSWAIALLLRTLILVSVCCKTRLVTFVLRGCDSISLVPYVPGPILATICRSE